MAKKNNNNKLFHFIIGVVFLTIICVVTVGVNTECHDLNVEIDDMNRTLTLHKNVYSSLDGRITTLNRRDYIEKIARNKIELISAVIEPIEIVLED